MSERRTTSRHAIQPGDASRAARVRDVRTALAGLASARSAQAAGSDVDHRVRAGGYDEVDPLDPPPLGTFDLRRPAALLFAPGTHGLPAGARYTAAAQRDGSGLDALVPLSIALARQRPLCSLARPLDWALEIFARSARAGRLPPGAPAISVPLRADLTTREGARMLPRDRR